MELIQLPTEDLTPHYMVQTLSETMDWGLLTAGIPVAHARTKGAGITVAVLDTGYSRHDDLEGNVLPGINCCDGASSANDGQGHGTHVSGIIAARENGQGIIGLAPEAKILPIKVLNDSGAGNFDDIAKGIRAAYLAGAHIINLSLGTAMEPGTDIHEAIKEATARGVFVVAAAGNDGHAVNYPARYDEVIAVAALDKNGSLADFSSRDDTVDISAPGVDIYSTYLNNNYAVLRGTSQASPFICGVIALLLSWQRANPQVPPITTVQEMLSRLDDMAGNGVMGNLGNGMGFGAPSFANVKWD